MFALVDCNNFFVSCERAMDPSLVGKAVAVLSNNDGCCVSRSDEFKALGIPMGTPYFQLKDRERNGEVIFRSSNHELYGEFSRRVMAVLQANSALVEQYSIDEAFVHPPPLPDNSFVHWGLELRKTILLETKIPCGIGFAKTKTLAKIANHIGKKLPAGVFMLPSDPSEILESLPPGEIWGIGKRLSAKIRALGIRNALELRDMPDDSIREIGGVGALKTVQELRGIPSIAENDYNGTPDSISVSRTFGDRVETASALAETIAVFAAKAAVKLRRHKLYASGCNIFAQYGPTLERSFVAETVVFPLPLRDTNDIVKALRPASEKLFMPGASYRKSGVTLFGLEKSTRPAQLDFFETPPPAKSTALYDTIDRLNANKKLCRIATASEGIGPAEWAAKAQKSTPSLETSS